MNVLALLFLYKKITYCGYAVIFVMVMCFKKFMTFRLEHNLNRNTRSQ